MKTVRIKHDNSIKIGELCVALGAFDGLHLGHKYLFDEVKKSKLKKAVLSFDPHPRDLIKNRNYPLITPISSKKEILSKYEIDYLIIIEFNENVKNYTVQNFIDLLYSFGTKEIVCGKDFKFAANRLGNTSDLAKVFDTHVIEDFTLNNSRVSSTNIVTHLKNGDITSVNKMLGRNHSVSGIVIKGNMLGRTIGFPTANIDYENHLLPKNGVYMGLTTVDGKKYLSMINVGLNPTITNGKDKLSLEVNIFDFDKDIYGKCIKVEFLKRIRDEIKFENIEKLKMQLIEDRNLTKKDYLIFK